MFRLISRFFDVGTKSFASLSVKLLDPLVNKKIDFLPERLTEQSLSKAWFKASKIVELEFEDLFVISFAVSIRFEEAKEKSDTIVTGAVRKLKLKKNAMRSKSYNANLIFLLKEHLYKIKWAIHTLSNIISHINCLALQNGEELSVLPLELL